MFLLVDKPTAHQQYLRQFPRLLQREFNFERMCLSTYENFERTSGSLQLQTPPLLKDAFFRLQKFNYLVASRGSAMQRHLHFLRSFQAHLLLHQRQRPAGAAIQREALPEGAVGLRPGPRHRHAAGR